VTHPTAIQAQQPIRIKEIGRSNLSRCRGTNRTDGAWVLPERYTHEGFVAMFAYLSLRRLLPGYLT
jgi:hypothetical protein